MKNFLCIALLGLLAACNNTGTTAGSNDLDKTDVDDSTSVGANLPRQDTPGAKKDTMVIDSVK
jgi:hypothetical protein